MFTEPRQVLHRNNVDGFEKCRVKRSRKPNLIPVGLHYSNSQKFRERGQSPRTADATSEIPPVVEDQEQQILLDKEWVVTVTESIESELKRASLSKTSWEERRMIWLARSVVHAERAIQSGEKIQRPSFSESVIGARRMRAGWEYYSTKNPEKIGPLVDKSKQHFAELESIEATPYDVAAKPEKPSLFGYIGCDYIVVLGCFMDVGFGYLERNFRRVPPYQANYLTMWQMKKRGVSESIHSTLKIGSAMIMFPIWWIFVSRLRLFFLQLKAGLYFVEQTLVASIIHKN